MVKTKEKIYDFGELGKWSYETLNLQITLEEGIFGYLNYVIKSIELTYKTKLDVYEEIGNLKIKKMTINNLIFNMKSMVNKEKLEEDYLKYRDVMYEIEIKEKKK